MLWLIYSGHRIYNKQINMYNGYTKVPFYLVETYPYVYLVNFGFGNLSALAIQRRTTVPHLENKLLSSSF